MLIAMRRGAAGWVAKILFGLLILSFAAWGIGDYLTPDADPVVAEVGDIEIRRIALDRAERAQLERMRRVLGQAFDAGALPENALRNAALEQLIGQAALDMEAQTLGLAVSDEAIVAEIQATPQFQSAGRFSPDLFRRALFAAGLSEEGYVASLRGDLRRAQLAAAVTASIPPSLYLIETMYGLDRQERDVAYVRATTEGMSTPEPTAAELKAYIEANAAQYAEPERRDARAIIVSVPTVAKAIRITDAEVANRYEDSKGMFATEERRTVTQALFRNEDEARAFAIAPPTQSEAFRTSAETAGAAVTELGALERSEMFPQALADAVFRAAAGSVPQPVRTALGWHVVLIAKVEPASTKPLAAVQEQLRAEMTREKAELTLNDYANAVEDALAAGGDLAAASTASGLPVTRFRNIDRDGAGPAGERADGLPVDPAFLADVFDRRAGEQSGLIELQDGVFVAVIVDAVRASAPKPFDAVKDRAAGDWKADKRLEIAAGRLAALMDAGSLHRFEEAAAAAGLTVATTGRLGRDDMATAGDLPVALVNAVFSAGEKTTVKQETADAVIVAFVTEVAKPAFDPTSEAGEAFIAQLTAAAANDRAEALGVVARNAHPPQISDAAMTRLLEQQPGQR